MVGNPRADTGQARRRALFHLRARPEPGRPLTLKDELIGTVLIRDRTHNDHRCPSRNGTRSRRWLGEHLTNALGAMNTRLNPSGCTMDAGDSAFARPPRKLLKLDHGSPLERCTRGQSGIPNKGGSCSHAGSGIRKAPGPSKTWAICA